MEPNGDVVIWKTPSVVQYPALCVKSVMVVSPRVVVLPPFRFPVPLSAF